MFATIAGCGVVPRPQPQVFQPIEPSNNRAAAAAPGPEMELAPILPGAAAIASATLANPASLTNEATPEIPATSVIFVSSRSNMSDGAAEALAAANASDFLTTQFPPREMVLSPILPSQGLAMLYSRRGVGKTYLTLGIAHAVARGGSFLRWSAPRPRRVLFVDGELPAPVLQQRLRAIVAGLPDTEQALPNPDSLKIITPDLQRGAMPDIATPRRQAMIESLLNGGDLLVLDNLSCLARSGKENEGESWMPVQDWALRLRQQGVCVLFLHHAGKGGQQRGTSRREDLLDT